MTKHTIRMTLGGELFSPGVYLVIKSARLDWICAQRMVSVSLASELS